MPSLHVVLIWFLAVMFSGSLITLGVLYCTRDRGQRAAGTRTRQRRRQSVLDHWRAYGNAAGERMAARALQPARCRHGNIALADGSCALDKVKALPPATLPERDEANLSRLSQALIEASVRRVYADIERRQVRQLAATAWRTWQG